MPARHRLLSSVLSLALLCLVPLFISPRTLSAQSNTEEKERLHEEKEANREIKREWRAEEWQRHNERYFGPGVIIERVPTESYEDYVARIHARCGLQWQTCSATCNMSVDPVARSVCIGDCNNDLYNCNYGF